MSPSTRVPSVSVLDIPRTVWALGLVSFFMDVSSETIHGLLPLFLTTTLGVSVSYVGLIDGVAESTAAITKVFSGYLSDRMGRRKPLILLGYGLGALTKPVFAIAAGPYSVLGARFADRIGKGLRGAPRDALVADVTPPSIRGKAFGLRQALDTAGSFVGPLLAIGLMVLLSNNMRAVFWFAVIPALLAVACALFGVQDRARDLSAAPKRPPIQLADLARLDRSFWVVVAVGVVFTLARFSEAFLVLRANAAGLPLMLAPLVLVVMNAVYALGAYPAGALSDRRSAGGILLCGLLALACADLSLAFIPGLFGAFLGVGPWGVHMAMTQGLFAKLVAEHSPDELRGSAYGLFNIATGLMLLAASVMAGLLWTAYGPAAPFFAGAVIAAGAAAMVVVARGSLVATAAQNE